MTFCLWKVYACSAINDEYCFMRGWLLHSALIDVTVAHTHTPHIYSQMLIPYAGSCGLVFMFYHCLCHGDIYVQPV